MKRLPFNQMFITMILEGSKTQTRRVIKPQPKFDPPKVQELLNCPYKIGEIVSVSDTIFLKITDIRVERLQEISAEDATDEGMLRHVNKNSWYKVFKGEHGKYAIKYFQETWNSISKHKWESNPWVWVYGFKRVKRGDA